MPIVSAISVRASGNGERKNSPSLVTIFPASKGWIPLLAIGRRRPSLSGSNSSTPLSSDGNVFHPLPKLLSMTRLIIVFLVRPSLASDGSCRSNKPGGGTRFLCRPDPRLDLRSAAAAPSVFFIAPAANCRSHEADSSDDSGSQRESNRHSATLCGTGNRCAESSERSHRADGKGPGSSTHRCQQSGASGRNARSGRRAQRLPCMAPEDSAKRPQRYCDWPRKLSLFPAKCRAASVYPGAVACHEPSGMEPFGCI